MSITRTVLMSLLSAVLVAGLVGVADAKGKGKRGGKNLDRAADDFPHIDANGDDKISREEWLRRGNFDLLDKNGDGFITLRELRGLYATHNDKNYSFEPVGPRGQDGGRDESALAAKIPLGQIDDYVACAIGRPRSCDAEPSKARGLIETGLGPRFPDNALCPGIDDYWAMSYDFKRTRESYHGGLDVPVPWGTPMLAAADGTVVGLFEGLKSARGKEVVLRHSPEQTGLGMWVYTSYGHMDGLPDMELGQRVRMGEYLGPTGNSGVGGMNKGKQSNKRRPAIHFVAVYSTDERYAQGRSVIIPVDGWWMDPLALYRTSPPFDSAGTKALPIDQKFVSIPAMFEDGTLSSPDTKVIWPYACKPR
ncbi:peptidoglycan DD-metalloendopeptidase family protein [Pseudomonadota bacterium]